MMLFRRPEDGHVSALASRTTAGDGRPLGLCLQIALLGGLCCPQPPEC